MKYMLSLIVVLCCSSVLAETSGFVGVVTSGLRASIKDSCAATGLLLSWHAEDLSLANEDGCSVLGDTTFAVGGGVPSLSTVNKSEGARSIAAVRNAYYALDIIQNAPTSQGTLWLDVWIGTADNYAAFVRASYDADNYFDVSIQGSDGSVDFVGGGEGNNVGWGVGARADTNVTIANGYWYRVKYQFNVAGSTKLRIDVWKLDNSNPRQTIGSAITGTTTSSITELIPVTTGSFRVGRPTGGTINGIANYIDNIKFYSTSDI